MKGKEFADVVSSAVNDFGFSPKDFAENFKHKHRTLQQTFTRACIAWLKVLAEMEYWDDRNEASVMFAKSIKDKLDDTNLPFI